MTMSWKEVYKQAQDNEIIPACALCNGLCAGCFYTDTCSHYQDTGIEYATVKVHRRTDGTLEVIG